MKFFNALILIILLCLFPLSVFGQASSLDVSTLPGQSAVYIKMPDGQVVEKDSSIQKPTYSTIKLWVAGAVMKAVESGSLDLTSSHTVLDSEKKGGTGFIAVGKQYSYDQLLEYMLTHSDNSATNILVKKIGGIESVNAFINAGNYPNTVMRRLMMEAGQENLTTVKDGAQFMEDLYAQKIVSPAASDKIISILNKRTQIGVDGIYMGKDPGDKLTGYAGKSGISKPTIKNEFGTFTSSKGRVFMSVMLTGLDSGTYDQADSKIRDLAHKVVAQSGGPGTGGGSNPGNTLSDLNKGMWCIKVGNPTTPNPCLSMGVGGGALGDILNWAEQITSRLTRGSWGYLNQIAQAVTNGTYSTKTCPPDCISNVYWCTYLIIDTYNLAGHQGLARNAHAAVVNMRRWWYTEGVKQGYKYIDYPANIQSLTEVKPGYAMMMERVAGTHTGSEHVNMVRSLDLDARGNGTLTTYDSNSSVISHTHPVREYQILNTPYPVRGFGGI